MGNLEMCVTKKFFVRRTKAQCSFFSSNSWHVFWIEQKFLSSFSFFFEPPHPTPPTHPFFFLRVFCQCSARPAGLQRAFTVKPNCARGNCPLPQPGRRSHKSRHPSFVTPPSRSSWLRPSAISEPFFFFLLGSNVSIKPTEWPSQSPGRSMGAMFPPSRPACRSGCVGRG